MARDTRAAFLRAVTRTEPRIAKAFAEAVQNIRSAAQRRAVEGAIQRAVTSGDIARGIREVLAALELGPEFFAPLDQAIGAAFYAGVAYQQEVAPARPFVGSARKLVARFDYRHPEAERFTRTQAARLVTEVTAETREVIRQTVQEAVEQALPYRTVTRTLIGTKQGERLIGGIIGLHSTQAGYVRNARRQLERLDQGYFARERRDRRFDPMVKKAIANGTPLSATTIDKITGRYADRLLKLRGETIARTEGNKAMQQGRHQQIAQLIERGTITSALVTKIWDATPDSRTRDHHRVLDGAVRKWDEPFISPLTGYPLQQPHDELAPGGDVVNCRCTTRYRINWAALAR